MHTLFCYARLLDEDDSLIRTTAVAAAIPTAPGVVADLQYNVGRPSRFVGGLIPEETQRGYDLVDQVLFGVRKDLFELVLAYSDCRTSERRSSLQRITAPTDAMKCLCEKSDTTKLDIP